MVTSSTRGVVGQRASISRSRRAVVDLPTATDPATPMTYGVRAGGCSPRNVDVASRSPSLASTYSVSSRDRGR